MKDTPLISIVTVCYNAAAEIEETILSVINQTYSNTEYIIVDGASTDGTVDVIKKYKNKITKWISEPDKGIYDAMNKAIDMATSEWINFMNAGDVFADNYVIDKVFSVNRQYSDVIFGNTILKDGAHLVCNKGFLRDNDFPNLGHQSCFVRTTLMKKYHFDTSFRISADFAFLYKLYKLGLTFQYVDVDVAVYDMTGLSSTHREKLYREHCVVRKERPQRLKLFKYKLEDKLPIGVIKFIRYILYPCIR